MASCDLDVESETIVTDFIQELSSGLEIPYLLSKSVSNLNRQDEVNSIENSFYETSTNDYNWMDEDIYLNSVNNNTAVDLDMIKDEVDDDLQNYLVRNGTKQTHQKGDSSSSGSECSSTEMWTVKNELDTPPVTPPEERVSPDVFVFSPGELKLIPFTQDDVKVIKTDINKQGFYMTNKKVRIQPKPSPSTFSVIERKHHADSAVMCTVFKDAQNNVLLPENANEYYTHVPSSDIKKTVLSREDMERLQARRKQERMIRNRESAYLSRKRKKEYVTQLEQQVKDLTADNNQLRLENYNLKERLSKYEELIPLSMSGKSRNMFTESPRKTTALLALMLTVCLNIGSFSNLINENGQGPGRDSSAGEKLVPFHPPGVRHTRSLLWTDPQFEDLKSTLTNITKTSCPMFINQTESIRLESELRRWIRGDEDFSRPSKRNVSKINQYFDSGDKTVKKYKNSLKRKPKNRLRKIHSSASSSDVEVDVYRLKPKIMNFDTFFEAIHRRDDTFYLVSFSGDHLLLPALAHNKTSRPKMSLMLPAFLSNTTAGMSSEVEMMQIDCEVTNTQLLSVNENDIPSHMRPYTNTTSRHKDSIAVTTPDIDQYFMDNLAESLLSNEGSKNLNRFGTKNKVRRTIKEVVNGSDAQERNSTEGDTLPFATKYHNSSSGKTAHDQFRPRDMNAEYFTYGKMRGNLIGDNRSNETSKADRGGVQYLFGNGKSILKSLIMSQGKNVEQGLKRQIYKSPKKITDSQP